MTEFITADQRRRNMLGLVAHAATRVDEAVHKRDVTMRAAHRADHATVRELAAASGLSCRAVDRIIRPRPARRHLRALFRGAR